MGYYQYASGLDNAGSRIRREKTPRGLGAGLPEMADVTYPTGNERNGSPIG